MAQNAGRKTGELILLLKRIKVSLLFFGFLVFLNAEPSAFESQSGATKKDIKSLKDSSLNLSSILVDLQGRVETLEQVQYGLQSLYDSQNQKIQKIILDLEAHTILLDELQNKADVFKEQLAQVMEIQGKLEREQQKFLLTFDEIWKKLKDVAQLGSDLNALVSKEFESLRGELKKQADVMLGNQDNIQKLSLEVERFYADKKKVSEQNAFKRYEKKSDVLKEAKKLYSTQQIEEAKMRFSWLVEQNYQKAEANYFLGQIAYQQKHYEDAIFYYKESATLDDKAKYMPALMLNTIKSFEALKDRQNTIRFIQSLLALYPKSKEAQEAKKIQSKFQGEKQNGK